MGFTEEVLQVQFRAGPFIVRGFSEGLSRNRESVCLVVNWTRLSVAVRAKPRGYLIAGFERCSDLPIDGRIITLEMQPMTGSSMRE
jgi:hypothetical protein